MMPRRYASSHCVLGKKDLRWLSCNQIETDIWNIQTQGIDSRQGAKDAKFGEKR